MSFIAPHVHVHIATPTPRIDTRFHILMERGIRPIPHPSYMPVFQRIHVHIIHMSLVVGIIAYQMFPIMPLPYTTFARRLAHFRTALCFGECARKSAFDQAPAQTEIAVARRQGHYTMQMLRQYHPCVDAKSVPFTHPSHRIAQQIDFPHQQIIAAALQQIHREEPSAARYNRTPVWACRYPVIYSCVRLRYANRTYAC
jgi:hypothetical protein